MTGKKASFGGLFLAVAGKRAWEGVIQSLKTLFQSDTSRNAISEAGGAPRRRLFSTAEILRLTPFWRIPILAHPNGTDVTLSRGSLHRLVRLAGRACQGFADGTLWWSSIPLRNQRSASKT
jgi:hypothetical protein